MKKSLFIFYVTLLCFTSVYAQENLTLDEAIEILKSENLELKGATLDIEAAKADQNAAFANHLGKLDLIQDVARSNDAGNVFGFKLAGREANFGDFGFSDFMACQSPTPPAYCSNLLNREPNDLNYPDARNFFQTKLKYEIPLFTGFQISSYSNITKAMTNMKGLEKEQLLDEKIYELRKSFYDMSLLKDAISNLTLILNNIETLENMTKEMIAVGYAKKVDLLEVQAKKGNVERLVLQMESNQELLYHYISFLLNRDVTTIQTLSSDVPQYHLSDEDVLNNNIDIKRANTGLEIRSSMVDIAQSSYYPTIGAFAELSTADNTFLGNANDHKAYSVGARLTWNLFSGGADYAEIQKSRAQRLKTKTEVELAKKGIILQVAKIRTEIKTFDAEILSLEKELTLADAIYQNYEGRYREKLSSMSDVIIKQSEQIEKILQLQEAKNKRNERIFALEKLAHKGHL
ncbi:MAG: TolC family protein [Sulfurimonadaceae bacterium]|jgi:outer membrane protein TolC|nr:TolC family protein [Sulfurimonadaceae bacterium]